MNSAYRILSFICALSLAVFGVCAEGISIGKGIIRIDDQNFSIRSESVPLNLTDSTVSIGFFLVDDETKEKVTPEQVVIVLENDNLSTGLYVYPRLAEQSIYEGNLLISQISKYLLNQDSIQISIITGDRENSKYNQLIKTASLIPSDKLRADRKSELPSRFAAKHEIIHNFRSDPKNLPGMISTQFVFLECIGLCVLILAWNYFKAANIENASKFSPLSYIFFITIGLFEYYFFDYYLGASIFVSLKRFAILGIFTIYFGSHVLNDMYKLRLSKQR